MKIKSIKAILLILTITFAAKETRAQQQAFTGTWKLTEKTNLSGTDYVNAVPETIKFSLEPGKMTITRTEVAADENATPPTSSEQVITEPGKATTGTTADNRKITATDILNGKELTESKTITVPALETIAVKIKEVSTLSDDGKTLTLVKTFENVADPNDRWSVKGIYQKQ